MGQVIPSKQVEENRLLSAWSWEHRHWNSWLCPSLSDGEGMNQANREEMCRGPFISHAFVILCGWTYSQVLSTLKGKRDSMAILQKGWRRWISTRRVWNPMTRLFSQGNVFPSSKDTTQHTNHFSAHERAVDDKKTSLVIPTYHPGLDGNLSKFKC